MVALYRFDPADAVAVGGVLPRDLRAAGLPPGDYIVAPRNRLSPAATRPLFVETFVQNPPGGYLGFGGLTASQAFTIAGRLRFARPAADGSTDIGYGNGTGSGSTSLTISTDSGVVNLRTANFASTKALTTIGVGGTFEGSFVVSFDRRSGANALGGVAVKGWFNGAPITFAGPVAPDDGAALTLTNIGLGAQGNNGINSLTVQSAGFAILTGDAVDPATLAALMFNVDNTIRDLSTVSALSGWQVVLQDAADYATAGAVTRVGGAWT